MSDTMFVRKPIRVADLSHPRLPRHLPRCNSGEQLESSRLLDGGDNKPFAQTHEGKELSAMERQQRSAPVQLMAQLRKNSLVSQDHAAPSGPAHLHRALSQPAPTTSHEGMEVKPAELQTDAAARRQVIRDLLEKRKLSGKAVCGSSLLDGLKTHTVTGKNLGIENDAASKAVTGKDLEPAARFSAEVSSNVDAHPGSSVDRSLSDPSGGHPYKHSLPELERSVSFSGILHSGCDVNGWPTHRDSSLPSFHGNSLHDLESCSSASSESSEPGRKMAAPEPDGERNVWQSSDLREEGSEGERSAADPGAQRKRPLSKTGSKPRTSVIHEASLTDVSVSSKDAPGGVVLKDRHSNRMSPVVTQSCSQSFSSDTDNSRVEPTQLNYCKLQLTEQAGGQNYTVTLMGSEMSHLLNIYSLLAPQMDVKIVGFGNNSEDLVDEMSHQIGIPLVMMKLHALPPGGRYSAQQLIDLSASYLSRQKPHDWDLLVRKFEREGIGGVLLKSKEAECFKAEDHRLPDRDRTFKTSSPRECSYSGEPAITTPHRRSWELEKGQDQWPSHHSLSGEDAGEDTHDTLKVVAEW